MRENKMIPQWAVKAVGATRGTAVEPTLEANGDVQSGNVVSIQKLFSIVGRIVRLRDSVVRKQLNDLRTAFEKETKRECESYVYQYDGVSQDQKNAIMAYVRDFVYMGETGYEGCTLPKTKSEQQKYVKTIVDEISKLVKESPATVKEELIDIDERVANGLVLRIEELAMTEYVDEAKYDDYADAVTKYVYAGHVENGKDVKYDKKGR